MSTTARTATGDLQIPRVIVTDPAQVALQTCIDVLSLWQGSWFMNLLAGFPWLQRILGVKGLSAALAKKLLRDAILSVPYVVSVDVQTFFDSSTRAFAYTFRAPLNTGQVLTGGSSQAFQVQSGGSG